MMNKLPKDLRTHYFEILFSIDVESNFLAEVISEIISDEIMQISEATEYLGSENIEIIESK